MNLQAAVVDDEQPEPEVIPSVIIEPRTGIDLSRVDKTGKTVIHYIVTPIEYGSYENHKFLRHMLDFGFVSTLKDHDQKLPYEYTLEQSTGIMLKVFKDMGLASADLEVTDTSSDYRKISEWDKIDYQKDAQDFLDLVKVKIGKQNLVPCDPVGKFNED